jgi:SpoIID/LytB domain protein
LEPHIPHVSNGHFRLLSRRSGHLRLGLLTAAATIAVMLSAVFAAPVSAATGDFVIQGRGFGHGVGMSQWGAWQAAREGHNHDEILAFYYPDSSPATAPAGTTIKVRISKDPTAASYDDHYYEVLIKPVVSAATMLLQNTGYADVSVAVPVGQIVETLYAPVGGVGHVWVVGHGAYDHVVVVPDAGTGRVAASMRVSSVAAATTYREYWGSMNVEPMGEGELYLNNLVLLDKYVRGVAEIKPEWANAAYTTLYAIEAVRAQAVAARTYAYAEFTSAGYVNDDTRDICYKGYAYEVDNPGAAQAATDTDGEILKYAGGALYKTYFSAHSGGYTTSSAWNDSPPFYVVSKPDPWSQVAPPAGLVTGLSPGYLWSVNISPADLGTKLIKAGYIDNVGTITKVEVTGRDTPDADSHVTSVRIKGSLGEDTISGRNFKAALGLKSTLFSVVVVGSLTRIDDVNPNIAYLGNWATGWATSAFGKSFVAVGSAAKAALSFDGTYMALVTKTGANYGKATITLDGGTPLTVDYYSPTVQYQQTIYSTGNLAPGVHNVVIEWAGTKNARSWGYSIGLDAVDVIGTLVPSPDAPPRYEQSDTNFSYGGPWAASSNYFASGGSHKTLNAPGSVIVAFTGTYLAWVGKTAPYCGKARVTLDSGTPTMVDLYSPTDVYKRHLYTTGFLPSGPHTVTIEWTGAKNGAATNWQIGVDAFDVLGNVDLAPPAPAYPNRYQQTHPYITCLGRWTPVSSAAASGGSYSYVVPTAGRAIVNFHGTGLSWLAAVGRWQGVARVSVDGGATQLVDLYNATTINQHEVFNTGPLADDDHTLVIEPNGTRNVAALGTAINLDAFDIFGELTDAPSPVVYEQTESDLTYVGPWASSTAATASGGSSYYLNAPGSVTVQFDGTYVDWVTKTSSVYGKAWLRLDSGAPVLVDLYSSSTNWKKTVWSSGILAPGTHTLCISWSGLKNASASAYNVGVDALVIMGALVGAPVPPSMPTLYQNTNAMIVYSAGWRTGWWSSASGGSFSYRSTAGSAKVKFDGTYFAWVAKKGPSYGMATVTVDGGAPVTIDLYGATELYQQVVFRTGLLAPGTHTVVIAWKNSKNPASSSYNIDVDAVDVIGTLIY